MKGGLDGGGRGDRAREAERDGLRDAEREVVREVEGAGTEDISVW
jgi:hypothetical protein